MGGAGQQLSWALWGSGVFMSPRLPIASDPKDGVGKHACLKPQSATPLEQPWVVPLSLVALLPLVGPDLPVYTSWEALLDGAGEDS